MDELTSACGHLNRSGARFCSDCGTALAVTCATCGAEPRLGARFCDACGTPLGTPRPGAPPAAAPSAAPAVEAERKQVTVLFADLARSMDLAEQFDPDTWREIVSGLFHVGVEAVRRYGGTIDKFTGDGLMALFGAPVAQEDHAVRGAHAALALVAAARDYAAKVRNEHRVDLRVRVGLNSGEVVAGDVGESGFTAVGHTVGLAQRMESLADLDTVRLSENTAALLGTAFELRDLGAVAVKGVTLPIRTFALDAARTGARRRAGTARLVGRDAEWAGLVAALDAADAGQGQVVGIVGEAGAGKSRLTEELAHLATERGLLVRRTAGVSHATGAPLLPIRALFGDYFGVTETDSAAAVRDKVGSRVLELDPDLDGELPVIFDFLDVPDPTHPATTLGPEARRRRVLDAVRRITRRRSSQVGLVFLMEDLHWFDEHSVRFLDEWLPSFPGTRTLIVTNFRPEFRAPWVSRSYYRQIPLPALDRVAVRAIVADLVGADPSLNALSDELAERSGGNPFFVEEIVRGWVEDGTLHGTAGAYALGRPVDAVRVPSTVQSVLADRIDRLGGPNKATLQAAAVIGREFSVPVLRSVTGSQKDDLDTALSELCAAELLQETGEQEYRFWHPLTQEVAYNSLLGATRRRHHRTVAQALLTASPGRDDELAAVVASHFEAAEDHLEAGRWNMRASVRASRTDVPEALRLMRNACRHFDALPPDVEATTLSVRAHGLLLRFGGRAGMDPDEAEAHAATARRAVEALADPLAATTLAMATGIFRWFTGNHSSGLASVQEAAHHADLTDDPGLQAWAHGSGYGAISMYTGPLPDGLAQVALARELCAGDPRVGLAHAGYSVHDTLYFIGAALEIGAGLLDAARANLVAGAEIYRERPVNDWRVWTLSLFADLAASTGTAGDLQLARSVLDDAHRIADEAGSSLAKVHAHRASGIVALLDGDPAQAERHFTRGLDLARAQRAGLLGEAGTLVFLARARLAAGDPDSARTTADEAVNTALHQGARVVACMGQVTRAQVFRLHVHDLPGARAAVEDGLALARDIGARTSAAFLAEEYARLDGGDLAKVADGYDAIGATGHAARIRAEFSR